MEYIVFIHKNPDTHPAPDEWGRFIEEAKGTGMFEGGSEIGRRFTIGRRQVPDTTDFVGGYMKFKTEDIDALMRLLEVHPMALHGGTLEVCELPLS